MNILITGGSGFIGQRLINHFIGLKFKVTALIHHSPVNNSNCKIVTSLNEIDKNEVFNVAINLAGSKINKLWRKCYKEELIKSRTDTTRSLVALINQLKTPPGILISGSAIGYYGGKTFDYIDENHSFADDFLHQLCNAWEHEAYKINNKVTKIYITRLGVVIGKKSPFIQSLLPIFKLGMGGKLGNGKQFLSWIHIADVVNIFDLMSKQKLPAGVYNLTAPQKLTNTKFTKTFGSLLKRPTKFHIPAWVIGLLFGEMGKSLLLNGSFVYPKALENHAYDFLFPDIHSALTEALKL